MADYTGGNWYLEEETGLILSLPEGEPSPVVIANAGKEGSITPKPLKELMANAHLITAAPDMYGAIKLFREGMGKDSQSIMEQAYSLMKQAQDKAEGGK
jgi:soluble P-type ATPase